MGQKINPIGFRLGVNRTSDSRWYADSADYGRLLHEDIRIRKFIKDKLKQAGVSKVIIERPHKKCRITVHTARPGMVIGKKGADLETLRKEDLNCLVIVVSADVQEKAQERVLAMGAIAFIRKPITAEGLRDVLKQYGVVV